MIDCDEITNLTHINTFDDNYKVDINQFKATDTDNVLVVDTARFYKIFIDFIQTNIEFLAQKHNLEIKPSRIQLNDVYIDFIKFYMDEQTQEIILTDDNRIDVNKMCKLFKDVYPHNIYNQLINQYEKDAIVFLKHIGYTEKDNIKIILLDYVLPVIFETKTNKFEKVRIMIAPIALQQFAKALDLTELEKKYEDIHNLLVGIN
jgi:hypothetical protein